MGKSVAELEVQLELVTAQFEAAAKEYDRELKKMEKNTARTARSFKNFDKQLTRVAKGLALAATAAATAFAGQTARNAIEYADTLAKTADKVGVTVEQLQKLRFAATQSGVDIRTLDMGLQRFSRRVGEVANGSGELLKVWETLGIELRNQDGSLRSTYELFADYADAVANADSAQSQLLLTFKAVDSEAAGLVNLFRQGSQGLRDYGDAADDLGVVFDDTADKAEVVADKVGELGLSFKNELTNYVVEATYALLDFFNATQLKDEAGIRDRMREIEDLVGQQLQLDLLTTNEGELKVSAQRVKELWQEYDELEEALNRILDLRAKAREGPTVNESVFGNDSTDQVKRLKDEIRGLIDPTVTFQKKINEAYELTQDALDPLEIEVYYKYISKLAEEWVLAAGAADNYGARVAAVLKETDSTELLNQQAAALGVLYSALERASDPAQIERIMEMIEAISFGDVDTDPPEDMVSNWEETLGEIRDAIDGFVSDFTNKLVDGLIEGELAFDDFAKNILSTIAKLMLNKIFTQFFDLVLNSIPGFGGSAGSGTNTIGGGAGGGTDTRMGRAVMDPTPIPMLSSNSRGGVPSLNSSPVTVNVINNGNSEVEVEERQTSRGIEVDVLIKQAVNRGIASGDFDNSMRAAYGTRRMAY